MKRGIRKRITSGIMSIAMVITSLMPSSFVQAETGSQTLYYQGDGREVQINVKGEFNNWKDVKLEEREGNLWSVTIPDIQPGIFAYGFYDDKNNNGTQEQEVDDWLGDPSNPYRKIKDNPILINQCNPMVNDALQEVKLYYPCVETVTAGALKINYSLQGSEEGKEATFSKDSSYENMYSVQITGEAPGTYQYHFKLDGKEITDKYARSGQTFVIPELTVKADEFQNNPGGNTVWRITGNAEAIGSWNEANERGVFSHLVDDFYAKSLVLSSGEYEFKFTKNGSWNDCIASNTGENFKFGLTEVTKVNFYIKEKEDGSVEVRTNLNSLNEQGIKPYIPLCEEEYFPRLVGDFQEAIGEVKNWSPEDAASLFVDYNFDHTVYKLQVPLPVGTYNCKVVYGDNWDRLNYGDGTENHSVTVLTPSNVVFTTIHSDGMSNGDGKLSDDYVSTDSLYDGKIDASALYFDSRLTTYKSPFGAIKQGQEAVTFRIAAKEGDAQLVRLELTNQDGIAKTYEMNISTVYEDKDYWEVTVPKEAFDTIGVWNYKFIFVDGTVKLEYGDDGSSGGTGATAKEGQTGYNLTVYESEYHTPDWMKNAVVYQIFPDRFYDGDVTNNGAKFVDGSRGKDVQLFDGSKGSDGVWSDYPENPRHSEDKNKPYYPNATTDGIYNNEFYGGDIKGIQEKLSYLQTLGVTAIYLNPVAWASSNHKYDATDYNHLDPMFGEPVYNIAGDETSGLNYEKTREASDKVYENFAKACDELGMYLISDGVFNHVGDDSIYFDRYENYPEIGAYEFWSRVWDYIEASKTAPIDATNEQIEDAKIEIMNQYKETKNPVTGTNYTEEDFCYINWFEVGPNKVIGEDGVSYYSYEGWWGYDSLPVIKTVEAASDNLSNDENASIAGSHEYNNVSYRETVIGYDLEKENIADSSEEIQNATSQRWLWMGSSGWRLDVAPDVSTETWKEFRKSVKSTEGKTDVNGNTIPEPIILGEEWNVATKYLLGDTFDSVMNYQFRSALQNYIINGKDASEFNKALEIIRENYPKEAWYAMLNLVDSHDTVRNITKIDNPEWEEENTKIAPEASERSIKLQALTAIFQLSYPGAPTIYYGDEVGVTGTKDPDSRRSFPWERVTQNADDTYSISKAYEEKYGNLFDTYVKAADVRNKNQDVFATGEIHTAYANGSVIAYARKNDKKAGLSVINTSEDAVTFEADVQEFLPDGLVLNDELGSGVTTTIIEGKAIITVPAMSGLMMVSTTNLETLPEAPLNVEAKAVEGIKGEVTITWNAVVGVDGYEVYRAPLEGMAATLVYSGSDLTCSDNTVVNGTRYYYYVKSVKGEQKSVSSEIVTALPSFKIATITTPTKVNDMSLEVGTKTETIFTTITIPGLTDNPEYAQKEVEGLNLMLVFYRTEDGIKTAKEVKLQYQEDKDSAKIYKTSFEPTDSGKFTYFVKATVNHGDSYTFSNEETMKALASVSDTTPPKEPILEGILQEPNRAELKWSCEDGEIKGFDIYRQEEESDIEVKVATVLSDATSYTDLSVSNGKTYHYRVAAFDQHYNRAYSEMKIVTPKITMIDVTLRLTIPDRVFTSSTDTIYVAGDANGWNAAGWEMKKPSGATDNNIVEYTFKMLVGKTMQYKYTRGNWDTEALTSRMEKDTTSPGNYGYSSTDTNIQLVVKNQGENKMLVKDYVLRWVDMPMMITSPRISYDGKDIVYETSEDSFNLKASVPMGGVFTINGTDVNKYLPGVENALDIYGNVKLDDIPLKEGINTFVMHIEPTQETKNMEWLTDTGRIDSQMSATQKLIITKTNSSQTEDPGNTYNGPVVPSDSNISTERIQKPETYKENQFGVSGVAITKKEKTKIVSQVKIAKVELDALENQAKKLDTSVNVVISAVSKGILEYLGEKEIQKAEITVMIPKGIVSNKNLSLDEIRVEKELIQTIIASEKEVEISIVDEEGKTQFAWNLNGKVLKENKEKARGLNLNIEAKSSSKIASINKVLKQDAKNKEGMVLSFGEETNLLSGTTIRINVASYDKWKAGDKVYIYHYNNKTKKLDCIPKTAYKVAEDGCITIKPKYGSDYVVLDKKASSKIRVLLQNQIAVKKTLSLTKGKISTIGINIPDTLAVTKSFKSKNIKNLDASLMPVIVTYKSSNNKIVRVNSKTGKIRAKAKGSVTVTATVRLKNGKKKVYKTKVIVKE